MSQAAAPYPNYELDPDYTRFPAPALLDQIQQFQRDGLLLLDHLAKRPARRFAVDGQAVKQPDGEETGSDLRISVHPLQLPAAQIAQEETTFRDLIILIDTLSRRAYPATPETIRNSRKKIAGSDILLLILMLVGLVFAVSALWRVDEGRKLVSDTRLVQSQAKTTYTNLFRANIADFIVYKCTKEEQGSEEKCNPDPSYSPNASSEAGIRHSYPYCWPDEGKNYPKYYLQPSSAGTKNLCGQLGEQKVRESLSFARLYGWNCEIAKAPLVGNLFLRLSGGQPSVPPTHGDENPVSTNANRNTTMATAAVAGVAPSPDTANKDKEGKASDPKTSAFYYNGCGDVISANNTTEGSSPEHDWRRSELRAVPVLHLLSHHLLPGGLALLGASVSLLLSRYRARNAETLRDGWLATTVLVVMPTALGSLIGIVWGGAPDTLNADQIKVGEFSFGVGAIAFFIGFIFEDFLNWLKRALVTTLENNGTGKIVMK